jgi:two-component system nitrogen regulation response regulator GlnG
MASNTVTVLIEGETGTGKDLVARAIHAGSERKERPFIPVDCGALPDELLESELFGYEAGAFTGARTEGKPGRFELADGGTLFLDEVGNMTPALQVKLLRALQTQEIERLGGTRRLKVDVRVIAATNQELGDMVKRGQFREDLYYRFKRVALHVPSLRERQEDIPLLVTHFLQLIQDELGKPIRGISEDGMKLLQDYTWPGNVRELENCLRSAAALCRADVILPDDLPSEIRAGYLVDSTDASELITSFKSVLQDIAKESIAQEKSGLYEEIVATLDKALIELVLDEFSGNHSKTADLLGMSRTTLLKKIRQGDTE